MRMLLVLACSLVPGLALAQGVQVTPKPCAAGASEIGGLCVAPIGGGTPIPPEPVACQGTQVAAGGDIAAAISSTPENGTICIAEGKYRIATSLKPKNGQTLQGVGQGQTILNGAKAVSGWSRSGSFWVATGFLPSAPDTFEETTRCRTIGCTYAQDVWRDGGFLERVTAKASLAPGKFYEDFPNNKIWIADDPGGHLIEQNYVKRLIEGSSNNVKVKSMTVEMTTNAAQEGVIHCGSTSSATSGWVISDVEVHKGHGTGVQCYSYTLSGSHIHHNGQMGVGGGGDGILIQGNEINNNNTRNYEPGWEGGGSKWAWDTKDGRVLDNDVHDNDGSGLWCDINCWNWEFAGNVVRNNTAQSGIFYEISGKCSIHDNQLIGNGGQGAINGFYEHSDILVSASPKCEVYNNTSSSVVGIGGLQQRRGDTCTFRGSANYPDGTPVCPNGNHTLSDLNVHDNHVTPTKDSAIAAGISQDIGDMAVFNSRNNRFVNNHYTLRSGNVFTWNNTYMSYDQWKAQGQN